MLFAQFAIEHPHILLLDLFYCHSFSDNLFINDETDEQTNHLDIDALAIKNFERNVVIVSHVFRLLIQVAEELWEVADKTCMKHSTVSLSPDLVVMVHRLLEGLSLYTVVLVLSPVILIVSTSISHTIASVLLVPIAKEVGESLPSDHAYLLIFMTGLLCSVGMGMPVSGFPNQTATTRTVQLSITSSQNIIRMDGGRPLLCVDAVVEGTSAPAYRRLMK
ncbi:uncharacterized protein F5891DRAFT_1182134 [Suillus fuscotomentosus]|uniref:Uncharacterized protein n=1 Tax=Suillus fuscotomentosus TaxID=1912939 RepID=A0AAD4EIK9_9AGAM|nr:uncharacterized protein F5891DRAFT_1182134 [Suillus fuscotomentosus]KAG1906726.1 hypothetical protein F5891DRAFT_1182134 [Suillus fuscotomentosus]